MFPALLRFPLIIDHSFSDTIEALLAIFINGTETYIAKYRDPCLSEENKIGVEKINCTFTSMTSMGIDVSVKWWSFDAVCFMLVVPRRGLEPPHPKAHGPEPCASTNSAIWASFRNNPATAIKSREFYSKKFIGTTHFVNEEETASYRSTCQA